MTNLLNDTTQGSSFQESTLNLSNIENFRFDASAQPFQPNTIFTKEFETEPIPDSSLFKNFKIDNSLLTPTRTIAIKDVVDLGMSKKDVYRAFTEKGRMYLPPSQMCSYAYFAGILTGQKKAFSMKEIHLASVPLYKELSVDKMLPIAQKSPEVRLYLPELPNGEPMPAHRVDRTFLINIMNTNDPNFFPRVVAEIEEKLLKTKLKSEDTLKVDPSVFSILQQYVKSHSIKHRKNSSTALVKPVTKKRKRCEVRALLELDTEFGIKQETTKRTH